MSVRGDRNEDLELFSNREFYVTIILGLRSSPCKDMVYIFLPLAWDLGKWEEMPPHQVSKKIREPSLDTTTPYTHTTYYKNQGFSI